MRAGILEWNRAFEDAGFRDAIRVLDAPDDSALERRGRALLHRALDRHQRRRLRHRPDQRGSPDRRDPQRRHPHLRRPGSSLAGRVGRVRGARRAVRVGLAQDTALGTEARHPALPLWRGTGSPGRHARPRAAGGARRDRRRRRGAAGLHRPGAQGAGHARGGTHARPAPQLPRLRRRHRRATRRPELDRVARTRRLGDGLQPARARARSARGRATTTRPRSAATTAGRSPTATPTSVPIPRAPRAPRAAAAARAEAGPPTSRSTGSGPSRRRRRIRRTCTAATRTRGSAACGLDPTVSRYDQTDDPLGWARGRVALDRRAVRFARRRGWSRRARATAGCGRRSPTC